MVTPAHIVPEWYFLPFYAILRSIPDKLGGVVAMVGAILVLLLLPVINTSFIRSAKFRPLYAFSYWFFVSDFILLGWIGQKPVESPFIEVGMGATFFYFIFLLVLVPLIGILETFLLNNNDGLIEIEENAVTDFYFGQDPLDEEDTIDYDGRKFVEKHSKLWDVEDPFEIEDYKFFSKASISILEACKNVEIENQEKPVASCVTEIDSNMCIGVDSPFVKKARQNVLESLLLNHPLDCPICDQAGECDLQDQAKEFDEIAGINFFGTLNRGVNTEIGSYVIKLFDSEISGNVIDLCPVGALTSKPYAFKSRPWELKVSDSIDVTDSIDKARFCYDGNTYSRI
eukprot:gene11663-27818_t